MVPDIIDNRSRQGELMGDEIDLFRSFISRKGLRNTPEREEIITEIFSTHEHFDVEDLLLRLQQK
jgi:Fur family ferric uptake transcriptional regulator